MGVIKIKNENGEVIGLPAIKGANGKSAYAFAKEAGYTGTEEEFASSLANSAGKLGAEHNTDPEAHADIRALIENMPKGDTEALEERISNIEESLELEITNNNNVTTIKVNNCTFPYSSGLDFDRVNIGQIFTSNDLGDSGVNFSTDMRFVSEGDIIDINENPNKNGVNNYACIIMTGMDAIVVDKVRFSDLQNSGNKYTVPVNGCIFVYHDSWGSEDDVIYSIIDANSTQTIELGCINKINEKIDTLKESLNLSDIEEIVVKLDIVDSNIRIGSNKLYFNELKIGELMAGNIYNQCEDDERLVIINSVTKGTVIDLKACNYCDNWVENEHGIAMYDNQGIVTDIVSVSYLQAHNWTYIVPHNGNAMVYVRFNGDTLCKISNKNTKLVTDHSPLILNAENAALYDSDSVYGDETLEAILNGRQVLVKTPNADGRNFAAIYSPIYMYQIPNYANNYLYLFYLKDEKQNIDLSAVGLGVIQMPLYGQLQMKLSKHYYYNPFE